MDKQTIRKIPIQEFRGDTTQAIFRSGLKQILTTRTVTIFDENVLIVNIHEIEAINSGNMKPAVVLYLWQDDFISLTWKDNEYVWRRSMIDKQLAHSYARTEYVFFTINDENRVQKYYKTAENAVEAILRFQRQVRKTALEKMHNAEKNRIDEAMRPVRPLPKYFCRWIDKMAFKDKHYIFYKRKHKRITGYCSYCEHDVELKYAKHNEFGVCPRCRHRVIYKAARKQQGLCDAVMVTYMQRGKEKNQLIEREFYAIRCFDNYQYRRPTIEYREEKRYILHNNAVNGSFFTPYHFGKFKSSHEHRWCNGFPAPWRQYNRPDKNMLYTNNLTSILKGTPWQYSQLQNAVRNIDQLDPGHYLCKYIEYPFIEYLSKLGLNTLIKEVLNNRSSLNLNGGSFSDILSFSKHELPIMRKLDVRSADISIMSP